jgi:hypothetical protein
MEINILINNKIKKKFIKINFFFFLKIISAKDKNEKPKKKIKIIMG